MIPHPHRVTGAPVTHFNDEAPPADVAPFIGHFPL